MIRKTRVLMTDGAGAFPVQRALTFMFWRTHEMKLDISTLVRIGLVWTYRTTHRKPGGRHYVS